VLGRRTRWACVFEPCCLRISLHAAPACCPWGHCPSLSPFPASTHLTRPQTHPPTPSQPEHIAKGYVPRLAGARLPGSYINHYCANGGVVVPQFGYPTDQQAIDALQAAYGPGYKVVGVPGGTREVLLNAGNVHWCARGVGRVGVGAGAGGAREACA
jgi:hypothetical protein